MQLHPGFLGILRFQGPVKNFVGVAKAPLLSRFRMNASSSGVSSMVIAIVYAPVVGAAVGPGRILLRK